MIDTREDAIGFALWIGHMQYHFFCDTNTWHNPMLEIGIFNPRISTYELYDYYLVSDFKNKTQN